MTDEEMAEEYANKNVPTGAFGYRSLDDVHYDVAQAYLTGLKAGRPKWHKVADDDLPKEQKEYWCKVFYYESEETFNAFLWFDVKTKNFKSLEDIEDGIEDSFDVKSWCEIPEYKGK